MVKPLRETKAAAQKLEETKRKVTAEKKTEDVEEQMMLKENQRRE